MKAKMKSNFNTALNKIFEDKKNLKKLPILGYPAWKLLYNNSNLELLKFGITEVDESGCISLTLENEYKAGYIRQCVGFVKAVTDLGKYSTSTWIKGAFVTPFNLPSRGDVIATFNNTGAYDYRHVAIVLSASNTHIYVIDQNWEGSSKNNIGQIIVHALKFTGNGVNNANNYSIVEK